MERTDPEKVGKKLAQQASELCDKLEALSPDEGAALALFGRAATASMWAAMARVDVRLLDDIIDIGFYLMIAAGRNPERLFPPANTLLETMTFMAWCHLERFVYRLDVSDLEEANRYATDALTLGEGQEVPEPIGSRPGLLCSAGETLHAERPRLVIRGHRPTYRLRRPSLSAFLSAEAAPTGVQRIVEIGPRQAPARQLKSNRRVHLRRQTRRKLFMD